MTVADLMEALAHYPLRAEVELEVCIPVETVTGALAPPVQGRALAQGLRPNSQTGTVVVYG